MPVTDANAVDQLQEKFPEISLVRESARDDIPTAWIPAEHLCEVMQFLRTGVEQPYAMLYDLTGIDERVRVNRNGQPPSDVTVVYHLLSFERNQYIRL